MGPRRATVPQRRLRVWGLGVAFALLLVYPADWAVWRIAMLLGRGLSTVDVMQTTAATLKGNRFEIYQQQKTTVNCSRSLLPQAGAGACWWLRRHPESVTQY